MSSLDTLHGIIDAANATRIPCLVGLSLTTLRYVGPEYVAGLVPAARNQATGAPLYFHLDHGADLDDVRQVLATHDIVREQAGRRCGHPLPTAGYSQGSGGRRCSGIRLGTTISSRYAGRPALGASSAARGCR